MTGGAFQNVAGLALPVIALDDPPEGYRVIPFNFILTPVDFAQSQSVPIGPQTVSQIRTIYVDNTQNIQQLNVRHGVTNQSFIVPAGGGAFIPTTSSQGNFFLSISVPDAPAQNTSVPIALHNYEIPPAVFGTEIIEVAASLPIGAVILWYGSTSSIPSGYGICDGTTYQRSDGAGVIISPNLTDQFVIGAGKSYAPNETGGSATITQGNLPSYNLAVTDPGHIHAITDPGHNHQYQWPPNGNQGGGQGGAIGGVIDLNTTTDTTGITINSHTTGITVSSAGGGDDYFPPYYALCYIMKI